MATKILAGLAAALVVTGIGVYGAFSGGSPTADPSAATLPVSEGGCCAAKARACCAESAADEAAACPAGGSGPAEAGGAFAGGAGLAAFGAKPGGCCTE